MTQRTIEVTALFPLVDRQELVCHMGSYGWDTAEFGPVDLRCEGISIRMRLVGIGDAHGVLAIWLAPADTRWPTVEEVVREIRPHVARPAGAGASSLTLLPIERGRIWVELAREAERSPEHAGGIDVPLGDSTS